MMTISKPRMQELSGDPGGLLIKNSWETGGCGCLTYEYVLGGLTEDFWSVLKKVWVDTGVFRV